MYKNYMPDDRWTKIKEFSQTVETPAIIIDLKKIEDNYNELKKNFPYADIFYAVKANPGLPVIKLLARLGSSFDIASIYELDMVLDLGVSPTRISYGNTIKKARDIKYAYDKGVRLYATDSINDVEKIAENAPGSDVFFRILVEGSLTADWPLSRKFGSQSDLTIDLIKKQKIWG